MSGATVGRVTVEYHMHVEWHVNRQNNGLLGTSSTLYVCMYDYIALCAQLGGKAKDTMPRHDCCSSSERHDSEEMLAASTYPIC